MRTPAPAAHRALMVLMSAACTSASPRPSANSPVGSSLVIGFFALIGRSLRNATVHCGATSNFKSERSTIVPVVTVRIVPGRVLLPGAV